jgi:hypothetical protein
VLANRDTADIAAFSSLEEVGVTPIQATWLLAG